MPTKAKTLDCIEMKRQGALRIHERTKDMTVDQKIAYWRERSRLFREEQKCLQSQKGDSPH
jgi:hypothetical protein